MLRGASWRLSKVAAATFDPSMSQFSRAGSTRSLIINGCEVIDFDSDEEEEEYPQYSQMSQASRTTVANTDVFELEESSDEDLLLDPARALSQATSTAASTPALDRIHRELPMLEYYDDLGPTLSKAGQKRKNGNEPGGPRKKKRTSDEVTREKLKELKAREREAAKLTQQLKRDDKEAAKLRAKEAKAQEKQLKEAEKEANKLHAEANKVVTDKKATLVDCDVEVSTLTEEHPVFGQWLRIFGNKLREHASRLEYLDNGYDFPHVMQWRRRVDKEFDEELREWQAVDTPYEILEPMLALFYTAEDLLKKLHSNHDRAMQDIGIVKMSTDEEYRRLGADSGTGRRRPSKDYQIFIVVTGVDTYCKGRPKEYKDAFKAFSVRANVHHRAHVFSCETRHELAQKLFNISADQGIKPYKLIKRSHLPYVSDIAVQSGGTSKETYRNMLMKLHKYTRPVADAVISHKPTLNQLMTSYARVGDQGERELLFEQVMVQRYSKAGQSSKAMNVSLSKRLHKTTFGLNPHAFVGPDTTAGMHH